MSKRISIRSGFYRKNRPFNILEMVTNINQCFSSSLLSVIDIRDITSLLMLIYYHETSYLHFIAALIDDCYGNVASPNPVFGGFRLEFELDYIIHYV